MKKWWIKFTIMATILFCVGWLVPVIEPKNINDSEFYHIIFGAWKYVCWYIGFVGLVVASLFGSWALLTKVVGSDEL